MAGFVQIMILSKGGILINSIALCRFRVLKYQLRGDVIGHVEVHDQDRIYLHVINVTCQRLVEIDMIQMVNLYVTGRVVTR